MAEDKNAAAAAPASGDGGGKAGKFLGLLLAVGNMAVLGGGAFLAYKGTLGYQAPSIREPQAMEALRKERALASLKSEPILYSMEPFTANLGGSRRQTIRVAMTLRMLDHDGFEEVVANAPAARDAIFRILNEKTFPEVESVQGKLFLKDQIAVALNKSLKRAVVQDIYFSDFVVQ